MANVLNLKPEEPKEQPEPVVPSLADAFGPEEAQWEAQQQLPPSARGRRYALMGILLVIGAAVAWWQASLLTFVVVLLGLATWEIRERVSHPVVVRANGTGLLVDDTHYPAAQLSSFDILQMPDGTRELSVTTTAWHAQRLRLPLGEQDPEAVRAVLSRIVPEEPHAVPVLDWWLRR